MNAAKIDNKYCLPIIKRKQTDVEAAIEANIHRYRYLEVWLDYVDDVDRHFATHLVTRYPHRLVMVFRRQNLEPMKMSPGKRYDIICSLSRKQVLVDLDVSMQTEEITRLQTERVPLKTIMSYHNYTMTPSDTELRSLTERMDSWGAHVTKIATFCSIQRDALRLLSLLIDLREAGRKCIILGMGKHGVITRVFGPLWGNEMSFAPLDSSQRSAPGQIAIDKLDSIMEALG